MKRKLMAILLLASMTVSSVLMTACSQNIEEVSKSTQKAEETTIDPENMSDMEKRQLVSDDLPNVSFNGTDFRVLCYTKNEFEVWAEEATGDICNDAVWDRNYVIQDRFNVNIIANAVSNPEEKITTLVLAGTDDYDLVTYWSYRTYVPVASKVLHNWYDVDYVNLEKPWYNKNSNERSTINEKLYGISSDFSISTMMYTYSIFFNEYLIEDYGFTADGLYQLVFDGDWTIDQFNEIISLMYEDVNANGKADSGDQFGFGYCVINPADVWYTAFGQTYTQTDENGVMDITYMNETTIEMFSKIYDIHINNEAVYLGGAQYDEEEWFLNQQVVFAPLRFYAAYTSLRNREFELGILPYPKWDKEQENYYTNSDDKFSLAAIPLTVSYDDLPFVGIVFEALNAETYKNVYPVYYDLALKNKYTDDPITAEIVDIIMEGQCFEFVFQFGETDTQRLPYLWRDLIVAKNPNLSSKYASIETALMAGMDNIYEYYED